MPLGSPSDSYHALAVPLLVTVTGRARSGRTQDTLTQHHPNRVARFSG